MKLIYFRHKASPPITYIDFCILVLKKEYGIPQTSFSDTKLWEVRDRSSLLHYLPFTSGVINKTVCTILSPTFSISAPFFSYTHLKI